MGRTALVWATVLCLTLASCATSGEAGEEGSEEGGGSSFSGFLDGMISILGAILSGLGG